MNEGKYDVIEPFKRKQYIISSCLFLVSAICFFTFASLRGGFFYVFLFNGLVSLAAALLLFLALLYPHKAISSLRTMILTLKHIYGICAFVFFIATIITGFVFESILIKLEKTQFFIGKVSSELDNINSFLKSIGFLTFETTKDFLSNEDVRTALEVGTAAIFLTFALVFVFLRTFMKTAAETTTQLRSITKNESSCPELPLKINIYLWLFGIFCFALAFILIKTLLALAFASLGVAVILLVRVLKKYRDERLLFFLKNKLIY